MGNRHNLVDLFLERAACPSEFLIYDNGYRSWKYAYMQAAQAATAFSKRLVAQNIRKGDKVIIWSESRPEWVVAFWGCILLGAIVVPIDYRSSSQFLKRVQQITDAVLILIGEEVRVPEWSDRPTVWNLSELEWAREACEIPDVLIDKDDAVEIVFTSGATGEPKGVIITHSNILANLTSLEGIVSKYAKWFRPLFPLRFLLLIPLSHMFGQLLTLFFLPLVPATVIFMRGYSPHEIVRQVRDRRVSVVIAVPKILDVLRTQVGRRLPRDPNKDLLEKHWVWRWWKYRGLHSTFGWKFWAFVVGAAPLPRDLENFWNSLGFLVIQGYGLTETSPIIAFNNPFDTKEGTVGAPISGMQVKIAEDGEILVRGKSVTPGYYRAPQETSSAFEQGWFHTGDIGTFDTGGNLVVQGRKKEVIVTPEGLKVFPEDVESVLNKIPGVRESAVVGRDRVHAVLVVEDGNAPDEIVRRANSRLENHQKIRSLSIWPSSALPRTESTKKIKHAEIQAWVEAGGVSSGPSEQGVAALLRKYAPGRTITPGTSLDELGLSSLDRVQLMIDLEHHLDRSIDETLLTGASTVSKLEEMGAAPPASSFPIWNRKRWARVIRNATLLTLWLPLTRLFAHARVSGLERLSSLHGPVIFAPNHQSHLDTPLILSALPARFRYRIAVAMWKEYFDAYVRPEKHARWDQIREGVLYKLVALFFNAFPVPQIEAGARESLRYIGDLISDNWSILFFPEGERTEAGEIKPFLPGVGLLAGRLGVPIVPVRLRGVERVLHRHAHWPRPGRVEVAFGFPLRLEGGDYRGLAKRVEDAVRDL